MKTLLLQDDFPPHSSGGAGIVALNEAKKFKAQGHSVYVISAVQDKRLVGSSSFEGITVFKVYSDYADRWRAYLSLYNPQIASAVNNILNEVQPDIVHAHNVHYHLSYHSLKLAKKSGAQVFLTAHDAMLFHYGKLVEFVDKNDPSCKVESYKVTAWQQMRRYKKRYNPFRNIIIRCYLRFVDKIFVVSNELEKALNQNGIYNTTTIHNSIDVTEWDLDGSKIEEFKRKHNLNAKKIILFGGRLSGLKGGEQAVRMLAEVVQEVPEALLLVIGRKDGYAHLMRDLATELGVEGNLLFTGWVSGDELKAAYHASDVVCVLSMYLDPFPTVNLEAMACKKPVVGTCFGGTFEIVKDGVTGYIVNPFFITEVARRVIYLLKNPEKARNMGVRGRQILSSSMQQKEPGKENHQFS